MSTTATLAHEVADRLLDTAQIAALSGGRLVTELSPASENAVRAWLDFGEVGTVPIDFALMPWQRAYLERHGVDPDEVERFIEERDGRKAHGDPSLAGDGLSIAIDADCPHCGWPERTYDTRSRKFGCIKCSYTSDERAA